MKDKKYKTTGQKRHLLPVMAFAVCILLCLAGTVQNAQAVDLSENCSLTVSPGGLEGLEDADIVIDLYRIADAVLQNGYDGYIFQAAAPYDFLQEYLDDLSGMTNSDYQKLAQRAAAAALDKEKPAEKTVDGAAADGEIKDLACGLYLVIARGADKTDYVTETIDTDGNRRLATIAESETETYTFLPELIALPTKEEDENGVVNTANPGEWEYHPKVTLKPEKQARFGSLEIVKTLLTYESKAPASFVFQVEAYEDESRTKQLYSNVVTITFTDAGQKSLIVDKIPVGAYVEVTEVYSGAVYTLTTEKLQTAVISAEETASVSFTNDYDKRVGGGGAITNRFEYHAGADSQDSGWSWTQE